MLFSLGLLALHAVAARPVVAAPAASVASPFRVEDYAKWSVGVLSYFVMADTGNSNGLHFGVMCGSTCVVYATAPKGCVEGKTTPIIASLPAGPVAFIARCWNIDNLGLLLTNYSPDLFAAITTGEKIGLLFPEKDDRFIETQFSLKGAATAVDRVRVIVEERRKRGDQLDEFIP